MKKLSMLKFSLGVMALCLLSIATYAIPGNQGTTDWDFWRLSTEVQSYTSFASPGPNNSWGFYYAYYYSNPFSSRPDSLLIHDFGDAGDDTAAFLYSYMDFPEFYMEIEREYSQSSATPLLRRWERLYSSTDKLLREYLINGNNSYQSRNNEYTYNASDKLVMERREIYNTSTATMYTSFLKNYAYNTDNLLSTCIAMRDLGYDHELELAYTVDLFYGVLPVPDSVLIWRDLDYNGVVDWGEEQLFSPEPGRSLGRERTSESRIRYYSYINTPGGYMPVAIRDHETAFWGGPVTDAVSIHLDYIYDNAYHHQEETTTRHLGDSIYDLGDCTKDYNSAWLLTNLNSHENDGWYYDSTVITKNWSHIVPVVDEVQIPAAVCIEKTAPNPFRESTKIGYSLAEAGEVQLIVYNLRGQVVRKLIDEPLPKGSHLSGWDGKDDNGNTVSAGVYLLQLRSSRGSATARVVHLK